MNIVKKIIKFFICFGFINLIYNFLRLRLSKVIYKQLTVNGRLKIANKGTIVLGRNITINSGKNHNIIGGDLRTNIIVRPDATLNIGNNVGISNSTFVCEKNITLEDDVLIGGDCKIYDTDFHSLNYVCRMQPYKNGIPDNKINNFNILIKKGAWLGGSCIVLKGVTIGCKSIIGAGSVVSKNIPDYEVWAGNPIKFIRKLSEEELA
jgi:acetyltransferase-like isoleucine patch superfamily enzyme